MVQKETVEERQNGFIYATNWILQTGVFSHTLLTTLYIENLKKNFF